MYIKFLDSDEAIECSVSQDYILKIVTLRFKDKVVLNTSGFRCYADKDCKYDISGETYIEFNTIYRNDSETAKYNGYQLSRDGSIYIEPIPKVRFCVDSGGRLEGKIIQEVKNYEDLVIPTVIPKENFEFKGWDTQIPVSGKIENDITYVAQMQYVMPLKEAKILKKLEVSEQCEKTIHAGVDVNVSGQLEHFSLTTNDQLNLLGKRAQISEGLTQFEYHQDRQPCRFYNLEEMNTIIKATMEHISYHTTYCNSLNMWITNATTKEEVECIYYGAEIPKEYQSEVLQAYLT